MEQNNGTEPNPPHGCRRAPAAAPFANGGKSNFRRIGFLVDRDSRSWNCNLELLARLAQALAQNHIIG
jgi:hypothetical protein